MSGKDIMLEPTPETTPKLIATLAEYYGYVLLFLGGLGAIGGYLKFCHKRLKAAQRWCGRFLDAPNVVARLEAQMKVESGKTLIEEITWLRSSLDSIRAHVATETAARRAIMQCDEDAFFEANMKGAVLWANTAFLVMTGRKLEQITGFNWRNAIHGHYREAVVENWMSSVRDGTDFSDRFRVIRPDESVVSVRCEAYCNKDELGNVLGWVGKMWMIAEIEKGA
jgi:PAS domain S-box-containing protein